MKAKGPFLLVALLLTATLAAMTPAAEGPVSGYHLLGPELRALQDDDFANPGMLWVDRGAVLWATAAGDRQQSCQDCHGDAGTMRGLANSLPRWNPATKTLENLDGLVQQCRGQRQQGPPLAAESEELLALTALIARQSRGLPIRINVPEGAQDHLEQGRASFERRRGQLDLSCADCHQRLLGARLRGETISAGMINGFPLYRLTWEGLGSRQRMIRWCNEAVRAAPLPAGSEAALALEYYLAWRSRGLKLEAPAVRR